MCFMSYRWWLLRGWWGGRSWCLEGPHLPDRPAGTVTKLLMSPVLPRCATVLVIHSWWERTLEHCQTVLTPASTLLETWMHEKKKQIKVLLHFMKEDDYSAVYNNWHNWPFSVLWLFAGLPDRLPDPVRPAAVVQHVLRPYQQRRETNPAVYRPLAPPSAAPHHLPSTTPLHLLLWPHHAALMNLQHGKNKTLSMWWWVVTGVGCTFP